MPAYQFRSRINSFNLVLSLDIMDESGEHISEYDHDVYKERLGPDGKSINKEKSEGRVHSSKKKNMLTIGIDLRNKAAQLALENNGNMPDDYCGPCYGADLPGQPCCNKCEDIQSAYSALGWSFNPDHFEQVRQQNIDQDIDLLLVSVLVKDGKRNKKHKQEKDVVCTAQSLSTSYVVIFTFLLAKHSFMAVLISTTCLHSYPTNITKTLCTKFTIYNSALMNTIHINKSVQKQAILLIPWMILNGVLLTVSS